jgi:threonine/homoserine/homoserine lactone efflux protein
MSLQFYLAYVFACFIVVIVPGPTVTLVVANSMTHGTRAGLINIAGTQLGLAVMMGIVLVGLTSLIETMGMWFDCVRIAGAAYLAWLGFKLIRSPSALGDPKQTPKPKIGFFWQGFLVLMSNPKALLVFGAFIPQFVDAKGNYVPQVILLGVTAMVVAGLFDSMYAILAGRARSVMSAPRIKLVSRVSGGLLIGGGIWLALARAR